MATTEYIRAAPGGTGGYKLGANYAPGVVPQKEAAKSGYSQNLWLLGKEHYLTEVGTMNMFVVLKTSDGKIELVTPPLDDVVLPGVTRDSVLSLAKDHVSGKTKIAGLPSNLVVSERPITMGEVKEKAKNGDVVELFGTGEALPFFLKSDIELLVRHGCSHLPRRQDWVPWRRYICACRRKRYRRYCKCILAGDCGATDWEDS